MCGGLRMQCVRGIVRTAEEGAGVQFGVGARTSTKSAIGAKSFGFNVMSGTW
jgi:hypothetical protein